MNSKGYIRYLLLLYIKYNNYYRILLVGIISLSLGTIIIPPKIFLNLGGCWKSITMLHNCSLQYFANNKV